MIRILYLVIAIFILILAVSSCQQALIKKEVKSAEVDSSLYFKQVDVADPFLERLAANPNQSFSLNKTIIPPPPPEQETPKYKIIEGFRVQIYAGVDSENALANKSVAKSTVTDTIYQVNDKGLIKLQVGDYPYYPQADSIKRIFRQTHFPGAWVVKTNIFIPNSETGADSLKQSEKKIFETGKFKIQVIATSDELKAKTIVNDLKNQFEGRAFYKTSGKVFKVFVGHFSDEAEARRVLYTIRESKYPDAWLVY